SAAAAWAPRPSSCSGRTASRSPSCRWSTPPRNRSGTAPSSGVVSVGDLAQYVVTGLLVGGVYALMSIGLALIFGVMRVVNFAQGDFMMLGMYLTYFLAVVSGVDPLLGALLTIPPFFLVGVSVHRALLVRVTGGGDPQRLMDAQLILPRARRGRGRAPGHLPPVRADGRRQLHRPHVRPRRARGPRLDSGRLRRRAPDRARAVAHAAGAAVPAAERRRLHHLPARALSPA